MRQFFQAVWWWFRVAVLVIVGLYTLALLWNNSSPVAISVWYWPGRVQETSIIALACVSFVLGGVLCSTFLALFTAWVRYRRTREHRRLRLIEEQRAAMARKASMLRVKPAPTPVVRAPKQGVLTGTMTSPALIDDETPRPIEVEIAPPVSSAALPAAAPQRGPFADEKIEVKVDEVIVVTPKRVEDENRDRTNG